MSLKSLEVQVMRQSHCAKGGSRVFVKSDFSGGLPFAPAFGGTLMSFTPDEVAAGQAIYTRRMLFYYDLRVLWRQIP
jgi:hypothetical protein